MNLIEALQMARYEGYEAAMNHKQKPKPYQVSPGYKSIWDLSQEDYEALQDELERWKTWCTDAQQMRDAYSRENTKLSRKVKLMFDWVCKAGAALDNQDHEHAVDCLAKAKLAANS